ASDPLAQRDHLRVEAPVVAEPERRAGALDRLDRGLGVGARERERLLAEDVLAGVRGGDHLRRVLRVRRREDDGVDLRVGEQLLVASGQAEALRLRELLHLRPHRSRRAGDEADRVARALDGLDQRLAPPAEADDRCVHHGLASSAPEPYPATAAGAAAGTSIWSAGSAARTGRSSPSSSRRTMFAPCASAAAFQKAIGRGTPWRPKPQSEERTRCSGSMYSSAVRTSAATSSGVSTWRLRWLMKPTAIFLFSLPL